MSQVPEEDIGRKILMLTMVIAALTLVAFGGSQFRNPESKIAGIVMMAMGGFCALMIPVLAKLLGSQPRQ